MKYKKLIIIGTSHIAIESIKEVEHCLEKEKPDIVALELDKKRFLALLEKREGFSLRDVKILGVKGWVLNLLGAWVEKKLGKLVGVQPGSEMKKAIKLAMKNKYKIALIDRDITITLKKLSQRLKLKECLRLIFDLFKGVFKKEHIKIDLTKVPDKKFIRKLIKEVKRKYPSIYKTLIEERDRIMAQNLYNLMTRYKNVKIVAIVGAGHEESIISKIKKIEKDAKA